jgi:hypothetical protein
MVYNLFVEDPDNQSLNCFLGTYDAIGNINLENIIKKLEHDNPEWFESILYDKGFFTVNEVLNRYEDLTQGEVIEKYEEEEGDEDLPLIFYVYFLIYRNEINDTHVELYKRFTLPFLRNFIIDTTVGKSAHLGVKELFGRRKSNRRRKKH